MRTPAGTSNAPSTAHSGTFAGWQGIIYALPALLAVAVYANSLGGDFVWDDRRLILDDRAITSWRQLGVVFSNDFFYRADDDLPYGYYRPLTTLTYLLDYSLWRLDAFGFHLTNVGLHAIAAWLVGSLLRRLGWGDGNALIAASLFAVHPIHSENVAWISGRTDVLAFVLATAALWPWTAARRPVPAHWRAGSLLLFVAALLAKEMAVVMLFWLVALERWLRSETWRAVLRSTAPFGLALVGYAVWRFGILGIAVPGSQPPEHSLLNLALSTPSTLVRYLGWLVWPHPLQAYVLNPYVTTLADARLWAAVVVLGGVVAWLIRYGSEPRRRLCAAMLAVSFLPLLNLARVASPHDMGNTMAERFCYFPSLPFVALVALLLERPLRQAPRATGAALLLLLAGWSTLTINRAQAWRDEATFLEHTLAQVPNSTLLWRNLARHRLELEQLAEADVAIQRIEALAPGSHAALAARAHYYVVARRPLEAIALQEKIVGAARQSAAVAINNLAFLYRTTGNSDAAERLLRQLIAEARASGEVYYNLAEIERARGENESARRHLRLAWLDRPHSRRIGTLLATLDSAAGDFDAAVAIYRRLLTVFPGDPRLLNNLAIVEFQRGATDAAFAAWEDALRAAPDYADAAIGFSEALRRSGQLPRARAVLEAASRVSSDPTAAAELRRRLDSLAEIGNAG